jgi:thiamine-phosphate pyrophosphorylase
MRDVFGLYLVLTNPVTGYERCAEAAVETGVKYLQLRMKKHPPGEVLEMARRLRRITAGSSTLFIVNDDVNIAREADADGVHLGQNDLTIAEARKLWPEPGKIFGLSTHNEDQEMRARALAPDYIGVGPVFLTPAKENPDPVLGPERMGRIIRNSPLTAVAIGGINAGNLPEVLSHGAANYSVVRAVTQSCDPKTAILRLQEIWRDRPFGDNVSS